MDGLSNEKKINRRRTRNRTQVIHFDLSELETLREAPTPEISSTPNLAQLSLNSFLLNNYAHENEEESQGIRAKRNVILNREIVVQNINQESNNRKIEQINHGSQVVNQQEVNNPDQITNINIIGDQMINNRPIFSSSEVIRLDTQRMFNFSEISNFFKKLEKRELFPKSKHDYAYKKSKGGETNDRNLLEERNLIQMRIEEDVIPCLNNNPFIQNDKRCRK